MLNTASSFSLEELTGGAELRWTSERGDEIRASITLQDDTVRFRAAVDAPDVTVVEYPVIGGIGSLGAENRLLHSYATGFLFHDPLTLFDGDADDQKRGVIHAPYPEGFSGATLQLMAYYAVGTGGFSFSADDERGAQKWFDFAKRGSHLEAAFGHERPDHAPAYDILVAPLVDGTWWEAADRYKEWAVGRPWCTQPIDRPRWLYEDVGIATFGINASHDRSAWLKRIGEIAGTPVVHVTGPNWARTGQDYENHLPGGLDDWFPTTFHPANVETIRAQGDRLVPFLFDLLFGRERSDHDAGVASLQSIPRPPLSIDEYTFPFLCPTTEFARELHRERDARLIDEGADALYYDISANNVIKRCDSDVHGHAPGDGEAIVAAYRELYSDPPATRGTEMVNEVFIDRLAFYQARAEASPASSFEADRYRDWVKDGRLEKVPLFAYVYHEYGPVRLDGWAKLSRESGDLFYWIAARILAWGGLFELNYEFSPLENLDGTQEPDGEHYCALPDHHYEIDPEKAAFVREIAAARVGPANRYLAYGTMLPPLPIESPTIELDWFHYNCPRGWPAFEDRGTKTVDAIVHCAWRHNGSVGVVLVNVDREPHRVRVPLSVDQVEEVDVPARRVVLVEAGGTLIP